MSNQATIAGSERPRNIAEYPLPHGSLVVALQGNPPPWVEASLTALGGLLALPPNWDSYGAKPVDPSCVWDAFRLLRGVLQDDSPAPAIVPTKRGGIQAEWHLRGVDLEIEVLSPGKYRISAEDSTTGDTWDEEVTERPDQLADWVSRLSSHPATPLSGERNGQ